jgi:hypothetical protein
MEPAGISVAIAMLRAEEVASISVEANTSTEGVAAGGASG